MFLLIDHSSQTVTHALSLTAGTRAAMTCEEATLCDMDGVIRATVRSGVLQACNESGFPEVAFRPVA